MMLAFNRKQDPASRPHYLSHFHLRKAPFSSAGGAEYFFPSPAYIQSLDMLQHLTQYSEELLLVVGEQGIGKTTLLEQYRNRAEEHWRVCEVDGAHDADPGVLFSLVAGCFGMDAGRVDEAALLSTLRERLIEIQQQSLPVLVVDNAHMLPDEALEMLLHLSGLEGEDGVLLRVILFAEPQLDDRLAAQAYAGFDNIHRLELSRLDESQVAAYLNHRLEVAGYRGESLFTARQLKRICKLSEGIPAEVNRQAHEVLQERMESERPQGRSAFAFSGYGRYLRYGAAGLALVVTGLTLYQKLGVLLEGESVDGGMSKGAAAVVPTDSALPIVRVAQNSSEQQMAMVIMGGQTIQISCSAPAGTATTALVPPLIKEVPLAAEETVAPAKPAAETSQEPQQQEIVSAQQPAKGAEKAAVDKPEEAIPAPPKEEAVTPVIESTAPKEMIAQRGAQPLVLVGKGFTEDMQVAVSRAGKASIVPAERIQYLDSGRAVIQLETGEQPANWAVQVSTAKGGRSNALRFKAVAAEEKEQPRVVTPTKRATGVKQQKPLVQPPVAMEPERAAKQQASAPETPAPPAGKPEPELTKPVPAEDKPVAKPEPQPAAEVAKASQGKPSAVSYRDATWVRRQPAGNVTLQLMAASRLETLTQFIQRVAPPAPLAIVNAKKNGSTLYTLLQGSYTSRAQAQQGAKVLGGGVKPWPRTMKSVQQTLVDMPTSTAKPVTAVAAGGVKKTEWLWSRSPSHYALQLAAASDEAVLKGIIRGVKLPFDVAIAAVRRNGKPWYLLLGGDYANRDRARKAIATLPAALRGNGPWPRSYASIQDEMSTASGR